jgi:ASC-1-like (ASCH) protein
MKNNECHVEVRLFDKKRQQLKIGDVIEFVNSRTQEKLLTQLRGIAIFENFEDMVDYLTPQLLGYDDKDELMLRFERLYPADMVSKFNLVGLFVKNMTAELLEKARNEKYLSL